MTNMNVYDQIAREPTAKAMDVAFVNENTLGHASYLLPFVNELRRRPELNVVPHVIDATPLPPALLGKANFSVRGLRKWGLDFNNHRWRMTVSEYVRGQIDRLRARTQIEAVVANTQSVALELGDLADDVPVFV